MRPLIAVITCHKNESAVQAQRDTWAKQARGIDIRFFYGIGAKRSPLPDEVFLNVLDNYSSLPHKVQHAVQWALSHGYNGVFKCDDDAYVVPERLSALTMREYAGSYRAAGYMHGGAGYWLGSTSLQYVARAVVEGVSEDGWVAKVLFAHKVEAYDDARLVYRRRVYRDPFPETPTKENDLILSAEFAPEEMLAVHKQWLGKKKTDPTDNMSAAEYKKFLEHGNRQAGENLFVVRSFGGMK